MVANALVKKHGPGLGKPPFIGWFTEGSLIGRIMVR